MEVFKRRYKGNGLEVTMDCETPILNPSLGNLLKNDMNMSLWEKRRPEAAKLFSFRKCYTA